MHVTSPITRKMCSWLAFAITAIKSFMLVHAPHLARLLLHLSEGHSEGPSTMPQPRHELLSFISSFVFSTIVFFLLEILCQLEKKFFNSL